MIEDTKHPRKVLADSTTPLWRAFLTWIETPDGQSAKAQFPGDYTGSSEAKGALWAAFVAGYLARDLTPCTCGGQAAVFRNPGYPAGFVQPQARVCCMQCGAQTETFIAKDLDTAVQQATDAWGKR